MLWLRRFSQTASQARVLRPRAVMPGLGTSFLTDPDGACAGSPERTHPSKDALAGAQQKIDQLESELANLRRRKAAAKQQQRDAGASEPERERPSRRATSALATTSRDGARSMESINMAASAAAAALCGIFAALVRA